MYGLVYPGFRNASVPNGSQNRFIIVITLHVHVDTGFHRHPESLFLTRQVMMHGVHTFDIHPVADDKTFESHFITQQVVQQPIIAMTGNAVQLIVGCHYGKDFRLNSRYKRRQKDFTQFLFRHIHRSGIDAAGRLTAADQVFSASQYAIRLHTVPALQT